MKRSIFISRDLPANSSLLDFLSRNGWGVHHRSLIRIEPIPFRIEKEFDWIFIASSNGAKLLLKSYTPPENTRIGVVGAATAKAVRSFGIFPDFIGNTGNMNELGDNLSRTVGKDTVLFVGAEGGSERIRSAIPLSQRTFIPIYRTIKEENATVPHTDVAFLTSPSNAATYLKNVSGKAPILVAIGTTTADFLRSQGNRNVLVPASPREEDVIALLGSL